MRVVELIFYSNLEYVSQLLALSGFAFGSAPQTNMGPSLYYFLLACTQPPPS